MILYVSDSDKYDNDNSNILRILKNGLKCAEATGMLCGSETEVVRASLVGNLIKMDQNGQEWMSGKTVGEYFSSIV